MFFDFNEIDNEDIILEHLESYNELTKDNTIPTKSDDTWQDIT